MEALGLLEVKGLAAAFSALDTMLKTTEISYLDSEKNLGAGLVTVIIRGGTSAVKTALNSGEKIATGISEVLSVISIPNPHPDMLVLLGQKQAAKNKSFSKYSSPKAIGLIEIYGFAAALLATDTALKSANVKIIGLDKTKSTRPNTPGLIMFLKLKGEVAAVQSAVKVASKTIDNISAVISSSVITKADKELYRNLLNTSI